MKKIVKKTLRFLLSPFILIDYIKFKHHRNKRFLLKFHDVHPFILDKTVKTNFDAHYVYHTSWAARKVREINPKIHIDIASSLFFCGIVSAFVPVDFYDYRPAELNLSGLKSRKADLTKLHFADAGIQSLSCMHTIEHIGLGRYGDPIDPNADLKAIAELKRVVAKGGSLLFVTPIGKPKIEFNAHRIYAYGQIIEYFKDFTLREFSLVTDKKDFIKDANQDLADGQSYGCGCFHFVKN